MAQRIIEVPMTGEVTKAVRATALDGTPFVNIEGPVEPITPQQLWALVGVRPADGIVFSIEYVTVDLVAKSQTVRIDCADMAWIAAFDVWLAGLIVPQGQTQADVIRAQVRKIEEVAGELVYNPVAAEDPGVFPDLVIGPAVDPRVVK